MDEIDSKAWRLEIKYGPEGEANYAFVFDASGALVSNLKIHHAHAVVDAMNRASKLAALEDENKTLRNDVRWEAQAKQATSVIAMLRAMISEMFGPIANIESDEATLIRGPESKHDGEAILAALQNISAALSKPAASIKDNNHD